jgi:hypothetical protein
MATEIDAKGDLVVGTGADTFARLAVPSSASSKVLVIVHKWCRLKEFKLQETR